MNTVSGRSIRTGTIRYSDEENVSIAFYEDSFGAYYPILNASQNISVKVCAQTFTKPQKPIVGATVNLFAESWGTGFSATPTKIPLIWYDPLNGTPYLFGPISGNALPVATPAIGPGGCVALDVRHPTGWEAHNSYSVRGNVTSGSGTEETYVDYVWRRPQCDNGIDDDNDGGTDYISYGPGSSPDTLCLSYSDDDESS